MPADQGGVCGPDREGASWWQRTDNVFRRILGGRVTVNMSKETAMKPIERIANYLKYGFAITEHQYMDCPRCGHVMGAGSNYQPKYCDQCGQRVSL